MSIGIDEEDTVFARQEPKSHFTKKDYVLIASQIKKTRNSFPREGEAQQALTFLILNLKDKLLKDNPRFDIKKFIKACER